MRKLALVIVSVVMVGLFGCSASSKKEADTEKSSQSEKTGILYAENMKTFNDIINGSEPVLVDFYADWCAPCRMMAPILEQVAGNMKGEVKILKVDVDKNRDAAMKYGIRSIPTLMLFRNGEVKWQGVGVIQADQIQQIVKTKS
jgi:thioredoxin 1